MARISGTYLKTLRTGKGYSIRQLADILFVSKSSVDNWEKNNTLTDIGVIYNLAQLYGLTVDDLLNARGLPSSDKTEPAPSEKSEAAVTDFAEPKEIPREPLPTKENNPKLSESKSNVVETTIALLDNNGCVDSPADATETTKSEPALDAVDLAEKERRAIRKEIKRSVLLTGLITFCIVLAILLAVGFALYHYLNYCMSTFRNIGSYVAKTVVDVPALIFLICYTLITPSGIAMLVRYLYLQRKYK